MRALKRVKSSLISRYAFYYFLIFLLPFIVLSMFIYQLSLSEAKDQVKNGIRNELNTAKRQLTDKFEGLSNIAINITINESLSPFLMEHPFYSRIGMEMLSSYIASEKSVTNVILYYFSNDNRYYSPYGFYELETLSQHFYQETSLSDQEIKELFYLNEPTLTAISKQEEPHRFQVQYLVPLLNSQNIQYGSVVFLFDSSVLESRLPQLQQEGLNQIYVINEEGQILLSNVVNHSQEFIDSKGQMLDAVLNQVTYTNSGIEYHIEKIVSEDLGISFISIVNSHELLTVMEPRNFVVTLLLSLFLLGILLAGGASYLQYLPIKRVYLELANKQSQVKTEGENELEGIQLQIMNILNQNESLELQNKSLLYIAQSQAFLGVIEEKFTEEEENPFIKHFTVIGVGYFVAMIRKDQLAIDDRSQIHQLFPIKTTNYQAFLVQIPLQNKLAIFVIHTEKELSVESSLLDIKEQLNSLEETFYLYYGQLYEELTQIKHSYIQAMIACDRLMQGSNQYLVPYREELAINNQFLEYPVDKENKWIYSLNQGAGNEAIKSLKEIFTFIYTNRYRLEEIKVYCFYLINLLMKTAATLGIPRENIQFKQLSEYQSLEALEEELLELTLFINELVQFKRNVKRDKSLEEIFSYILNHYTSPELSLEFLADKYEYSTPYLSKIIKDETGMTFTKYVQELRLSHIKEQLVETDLPIKDIINQSGYYDVSNFSRKFKSILGVTPGQYRALHRHEK